MVTNALEVIMVTNALEVVSLIDKSKVKKDCSIPMTAEASLDSSLRIITIPNTFSIFLLSFNSEFHQEKTSNEWLRGTFFLKEIISLLSISIFSRFQKAHFQILFLLPLIESILTFGL